MTAEELLEEDYFHLILDLKGTEVSVGEIQDAMREFARIKCQELLEIVVEKAKTKTVYESNDQPSSSFGDYEYSVVDKDSVLKAVDLNEFIK